MTSIPHEEDTTLELYVKVHPQELSEIILTNDQEDLVIPLYSTNERIKKYISENTERIDYLHPIDVVSFHHNQNEYPEDPDYQDYEQYRERNLNTILNTDLEKNEDFEGEYVLPIPFTALPYLLYDKTDDCLVTDKEGNLTTVFDEGFDSNTIDTSHHYEIIIFTYLDDKNDIIEWIDPPNNNLSIPHYGNTLRTNFPRYLYPFRDTVHFPVKFVNTLTPQVTINWDDNNNEKGQRPQELTLSLSEKNSQEITTTLQLSPKQPESNRWQGNFEDVIAETAENKPIDYQLSDIPDLTKKGYYRQVSGNTQEGFTITYSTKPKVTVTFDPNQGTFTETISPITLDKNQSLGTQFPLTKPVRKDYTFKGWATDKEATTPNFTKETPVLKTMTVYALWEKKAIEAPSQSSKHSGGGGHSNALKPVNSDGLLDTEKRTNYLTGYEDHLIKPQQNINRTEVAAIFFRLLKPEVRQDNLQENSLFKDVSVTSWYNKSVGTMTQLNLIKGRKVDAFVPNAPITRAEFAAIAARFDKSKTTTVPTFNDINNHWAATEIQRAASLGWIKGYPDGSFKPNQLITRAEATTLINHMLGRLPENNQALLPEMKTWSDNSDTQAWYYLAIQAASNSYDYRKKGIYEIWTKINPLIDWKQYS